MAECSHPNLRKTANGWACAQCGRSLPAGGDAAPRLARSFPVRRVLNQLPRTGWMFTCSA